MKRLSDEKLSFLDRWRQKRIIKKLLTIDKNYWMGINHTLNRWRIPQELHSIFPRWYKKSRLPKKAFAFITPIMKIIDAEFSHEEQLRYHNVVKGKMTDAEFDYWYSQDRFGKLSEEYYIKREYMDKIDWWKEDVFEKIKTTLETDTPKSN